ncbi:flavodoxin domain-containing protein [Planctobacterium marinum]|uniref:NAD(P)H dehydrogenase (Quinone) n=1 Tax=Planctobacterium marinum TaxID=1631968 RepID=A0AA48KUQ2_9ALTE|nr:NAD(P)H dehydrogenase (quinone) [Planctobacterium marinum]
MSYILVLYYSQHGATKKLAERIAMGIESENLEARVRTVSTEHPSVHHSVVSEQDLEQCIGLALGSPTRFGQMAWRLQKFMQNTSAQWLKGVLEDKPAIVFTSSSSMHGGQESTLLSMALPLLHHGMLLSGIPYSAPELHQTTTGGSPYGASHVVQNEYADKLSDDEKKLAFESGKRLARLARKLKE